MNATRKRTSAGRLPNLLGGLGSPAARGVIVVLLVVAAVSLATWYGWKRWGATIVGQSDYQLTADDISVTAPPPWIHADVKAEVIRDAALNELHILDPELALQIQQAFSLHAWVADVRRVRKRFPPHVLVELEYRRPVAMVKAVSGGYWPLDAEAVLLPPEEFSPEQTRHFLRVLAENSQPAGPVGTPYGDDRVVGAARIAELLAAHRELLGIDHVRATSQSAGQGSPAEPTYTLYTAAGTRILWGRAPGREGPGEVTGTEKVARLLAFHRSRGGLDSEEGPAEIDLRDPSGIGVSPRAARRTENGEDFKR